MDISQLANMPTLPFTNLSFKQLSRHLKKTIHLFCQTSSVLYLCTPSCMFIVRNSLFA